MNKSTSRLNMIVIV
ncbi:hypothetical protein LINGRAHAP2_LOCUS4119 [Linum grandiflorum]